jgi:hypothetical protein
MSNDLNKYTKYMSNQIDNIFHYAEYATGGEKIETPKEKLEREREEKRKLRRKKIERIWKQKII